MTFGTKRTFRTFRTFAGGLAPKLPPLTPFLLALLLLTAPPLAARDPAGTTSDAGLDRNRSEQQKDGRWLGRPEGGFSDQAAVRASLGKLVDPGPREVAMAVLTRVHLGANVRKSAEIAAHAKRGIDLTTVGFGMGNYNDVLMEKVRDDLTALLTGAEADSREVEFLSLVTKAAELKPAGDAPEPEERPDLPGEN